MDIVAAWEVAEILGMSESAFCAMYGAACFGSAPVGGRGVSLPDLPAEVRNRYYAVHPREAAAAPLVETKCGGDVPAVSGPITIADVEASPVSRLQVEVAKTYAAAPNHRRKSADKYVPILAACADLSGGALRDFVESWNQAHPDKTTSYQSIVRKRNEVERAGPDALFNKYGKTRGRSIVPDEPYRFFKGLWMTDRRRTDADCWQKTYGWASERGYDMKKFPSVKAFMKKLENDVPENARYLARFGPSAYNRKYGSTVTTDHDDLLAGQYWVADHTKPDLFVLDESTGKQVSPELTLWRDVKSGFWLAADVHGEPSNSYHIFKTFRKAALKYGVPCDILTDNGLDFKAKDFTGGRKKKHVAQPEQERVALCAALGIQVHFAQPYHGQSKPIERDFRIFEEKLVKDFEGYKGNNPVNKPESLKLALARARVRTLAEFQAFVDDYIDSVMNRRIISSGYREGKSPLEIMNAELPLAAKRGLVRKLNSADELDVLCYRTSRLMTVSRNWIWDSECGVSYYADWILGQTGRRVYLKRDYDKMDTANVHDAQTNEFLGEVFLQEKVPVLAKTENQKSILKKRLNDNKLAEKVVRLMADPGMDISAEESQSALRSYVRAQEKESVANAAPLNVDDVDAPMLLTYGAAVIARREEQRLEGEQDLSVLGLGKIERPKLPRVFGTEAELELAAMDGDPDALAIVARAAAG